MARFPWPNLLSFPTVDPDFSSALAKHSCHSHLILMLLLETSQKRSYFSCLPCFLYFLPSIYPLLHPHTHKYSLAWTGIMPIQSLEENKEPEVLEGRPKIGACRVSSALNVVRALQSVQQGQMGSLSQRCRTPVRWNLNNFLTMKT